MPDILHRVGVKSSPTDGVYDVDHERRSVGVVDERYPGDNCVGGVLQFRFPDGGFDMKVLELDPAERVLWEVIDGPDEWINTRIRWTLRQEGSYNVLLFAHEGWKEPVEYMHHCSTKWGTFLMNLKSLVEFGEGPPAPNDVRIGNWN